MTKEEIIQGLYRGDSRIIKEAVKMLEQETVSKEVYNSEYFAREHTEYKLYEIQQNISDDCVSRQAVKEGMIKYGFHAPDMTVTEFIEDELPPVTPTHGTCKDCKSFCCPNGIMPTCKKCFRSVTEDFYCAHFEKRGSENG